VNHRMAVILGAAAALALAPLPAMAQPARGGHPPGPGHAQPAPHGHAANYPRANQGHIPPPPAARRVPTAPREVEHLPTGHVNDLPHVNGNHWYGHAAPNDPHLHLAHPFAHGHFAHVGPSFRYAVARVDLARHWFWLPGGGSFQVALSDWPLCADWCWDCGDDFVVYDDPDHAGWYLVYNVHLGVYVHAQYMGA